MMAALCSVIAGLDPAIHGGKGKGGSVDARIKSGHDGV
jgi:hypothetical protein